MVLKSYFELDNHFDYRTMNIFRGAEIFLKKNKASSKNHRTSYRNFVSILILLYKIKHQEGKLSIEKVVNKMENKTLISDKKWLLEKIALMKKLVN